MSIILTGIFTTRSPLSHIGETISTGSLLNERPIIQGNGELVSVFCYNANAWRGQLRDCTALYLIDKLGIKSLSTEKHNFLFSGGKIGGASKFDVANIRKHFEAFPALNLFGGCLDNMILPGQMAVMDALPLCHEAITELPGKLHRAAVEQTYRRMTIEREFTRMDDSKNMRLNQTISASDMDVKETIQMRAGGELLNSGVDLFTRIIISTGDKALLGALCSALLKFAEYPFIGGQHNKGHGKVDLSYEIDGEHFFSVTDFEVRRSERFDKAIAVYNTTIIDNKEHMLELLR